MKKHFSLLALIFSLFIISSSCKKTEDPKPSSNNSSAGTPKEAYEKKWIINNATNRIAAGSDSTAIASIEFNNNTYIIILTDNTIITGTFTVSNTQQLVLTNYGTVIISELNNTNFNFVINRNNNTVSLASSSAPLITSTDREPTFYKTWKFTSYSSDWDEVDSSFSHIDELYVTFSAYGTYLVQTKYKNGYTGNDSATTDGIYYYDVNTWKWSDDSHNGFCYGKWNHTNDITCDSDLGNHVSVSFNDAENIEMKAISITSDSTYHVTYELQLQ
jgi:hypothetical protein